MHLVNQYVNREKITNEDNKKIKVTMVAWDCLDNHIITAVSDYSLKVNMSINQLSFLI